MQELLERGGLEELAAFLAVAEAGTFVEAARIVGRDASVVSRRVTQLEKRLGVSLFSRTTRHVALTEIGATYRERVQGILDELGNASREASDLAASPQGLVRVSIPTSFGRLWIAPLLPAFLERHPQIRIDLRLTDRFVDIVAEGFDVLIRLGALPDSSLTARRISSYRYLLVAAPGYLCARGTPTTPAELEGHACLGFTGHVSWPDWPLTRDGKRVLVRPWCTLVSDNSEVLLHAALKGAGIMRAPDWLAGSALRDGRLREVLPEWANREDGSVHAVMPPGRLVPAKVRVFVDEIAAAVKVGWESSP